MNKLEVNISLLIMTFLASVQYVFLAGVPENISHFAFLCVTNLVGFLITIAFFFGELFRLDTRQVFQSMLLSAELVVFNLFLLLGVRGISATVAAAVIVAYFVFITAFYAVFQKQPPSTGTLAGVIAVLFGLFMTTDADISGFMNMNVFYLVAADIVFALYVITVGKYAASSNPSILAMGQMFFCFLFSLGLWTVEAVFFRGYILPAVQPKILGQRNIHQFFHQGSLRISSGICAEIHNSADSGSHIIYVNNHDYADIAGTLQFSWE